MSDTDPVFHIPIPDWGIPSVLLSLPLSADKTSPYFPMHKEYFLSRSPIPAPMLLLLQQQPKKDCSPKPFQTPLPAME